MWHSKCLFVLFDMHMHKITVSYIWLFEPFILVFETVYEKVMSRFRFAGLVLINICKMKSGYMEQSFPQSMTKTKS